MQLSKLTRYIGLFAEHRQNGQALSVDINDWTLSKAKGMPQQKNGYDCGFFLLKFVECLAMKKEINFGQEEITHYRNELVYKIIQGNYNVFI